MDSKLKCTFVLPEGSEMNNGSTGVPSTIGSAPSIKSDSEHLKQGALPSSPKVSVSAMYAGLAMFNWSRFSGMLWRYERESIHLVHSACFHA